VPTSRCRPCSSITPSSRPGFEQVRSSNAGDGEALAIEVPANDNVYVGAEGQPALTLVSLGRSGRFSQSIPVTFTFERARSVTIGAMVAAEGQPRAAGSTSRSRRGPDR
jgi:hypothetical protein